MTAPDGADNKSAVAAAINHFGVTEADLRKVMATALEKGGDYADLYFEHTFNNNVSLMDGKVNNCGSNIDFGMGVPHALPPVLRLRVRRVCLLG